MHRLIAIVAFVAGLTGGASANCLVDQVVCKTPLGDYHIALPEGVDNPPALVFLHGAGGSGKSASRFKAALERGYAVIGPNGLERPNSRFGSGWSFHPDRPQQRDEAAFIHGVIADAAQKFGIDANNILLAGFSIGGSLVSYLACDVPGLAKAYAPVAGSFWRPHPELQACLGPVNLLHTHGWSDKVVPLEGRPLGGGRIYQGDVFYAMQIWRETNKCDGMRADTFDTAGDFWRRKWDSCDDGALEFALHKGAHGIPKGWTTMALDWFETLN